jgi:hypothetical protein
MRGVVQEPRVRAPIYALSGEPMDAQLLISDIRSIRVTRVCERIRRQHGDQEFVRVITVRYADESEYEILLTANDADSLQLTEQEPPAP